MSNELIIAIISILGTTVGSFSGVIASSRLTNHRIEQLENKVSGFAETARKTIEIEVRLKSISQRVQLLEDICR